MTTPDRSTSLVAVPRRTFLKTSGSIGLAATVGGVDAILAARRAPAFAQASKLHLLQWVDFIPEGDAELRRQAAEYSITDMYAKAAQGMSPEDAVKWAETELKKIYEV